MKSIRLWLMLACGLLLSACAQEFPKQPWSASDSDYRELLAAETDFDSRLELARLYFIHNHIDEADTLLSTLVSEQPDNMQAKAWHGANQCKIAGRKGPWLMGLDKLYGVWRCLGDVQDAVAGAPGDFTVRMVQINTDAEVGLFGSRDRAAGELAKLFETLDAKPDFYAPTAKSAILEAAVRLEALKSADPGKRREYLRRIVELNADAQSVQRARDMLAEPA